MYKFTFKILLGLALFCSNLVKSQTNLGTLNGFVTDSKGVDTLIGAIVSLNKTTGATTNLNGFYELKMAAGKYTLKCTMLGYKTFETTLDIIENTNTNYNIMLVESNNTALDEVVISAGKFEQKLSEVTVSMEVIKPALIDNKNTTSLDAIINQVPGVSVADGQEIGRAHV